MFHSRDVLEPLLVQARQDCSKPILLHLAFNLVKFAPNYYSSGPAFYSDESKVETIKILKAHGLTAFCNLSPRWKKQTLEKIRLAVEEAKA